MLLHGRCGGYSTNGLDPVPRIIHLKYLRTVPREEFGRMKMIFVQALNG